MVKKTTAGLLLSLSMLSACSTVMTSKERFPDFAEQSKGNKTVSVVLDTMVLTDIQGRDVGYNKEKNQQALDAAKAALQVELERRGYQAQFVYVGSGLSFKPEENVKYFLSENWKSTGEAYQGPYFVEGRSDWSEGLGAYFTHLSEYAQGSGVQKKSAENQEQEKSSVKSLSTLPELLKQLPSDLLLYVRTSSGDISAGKSAAVGALTGVLTLALTGGTMMSVSTTVSATDVEITALDVEGNQVLWHNTFKGGNYNKMEATFKSLLEDYPTVDGEYLVKPKPPETDPTI